MAAVLTALVGSTLLSAVVAGWLSLHAGRLGLVQAPTLRSSHSRPTPSGGGLGIVLAATLTGIVMIVGYGWAAGTLPLALAALLAVVGLRDDMRHVPALVRFAAQAAVTLALFTAAGPMATAASWIAALHVPHWLIAAALVVAGMWWINVFNFMDGIDGLAATQAIFMVLFAALAALWVQPGTAVDPAWIFMVSVAAAALGFLIMNWPPARIFMGDVGSTWLGFVTLALGLICIQKDWLNAGACLILPALFVVDATVTLMTRMTRGERWHEAHRSHAYQRLSRRWGSDRNAGHRSVTLLFALLNLVWVAPWAWASLRWPDWSVACVLAAYLPLVAGAVWLGAGRPDQPRPGKAEAGT